MNQSSTRVLIDYNLCAGFAVGDRNIKYLDSLYSNNPNYRVLRFSETLDVNGVEINMSAYFYHPYTDWWIG